MWKEYEIQNSVPINKILLEHSQSIPLHIVCGGLITIVAQVSSCSRDHKATKPEVFTFWSFKKKFAIYLSKRRN